MLSVLSMRVLLFYGTVVFQSRFSRTLNSLADHGMKPSKEVVSSRRRVRYDVLLSFCDQGVYLTPIKI